MVERGGAGMPSASASAIKNVIITGNQVQTGDNSMKTALAVFAFAAVVSAQESTGNPLVSTSKGLYAISKGDVLGSVEKIPDDLWSYQPTKDVRTIGQLFAHIADGQYEFCGAAEEGHPVSKDIEKTMKTKTEIVAALNTAFAY